MIAKEIIFTESDGLVKNEITFTREEDFAVEPSISNVVLNKGSKLGKSITYLFREIFLPDGFPESVHSDYIAYQIWNAIQVFASTVVGTLTTHSVLKGVGVGESSATALAAAITWTLKDGTGSISRILFVWWQGNNLDAQSKKWRLFADGLNDLAMGIELLVPLLSEYALFILCMTTAMKSIVGVAGSATRMALKQHQALRKNLADVAAKEGSQETFINLVGLLTGVIILLYFNEGYFVHLYALLVFIHLYANFTAIRSLEMNSLNEDRLCLIIRDYLLFHTISGVKEVNKREALFSWRKPAKRMFGFDIEIGASFEQILKLRLIETKDIQFLLAHFQRRKYLSVMDIKRRKIHLVLAKDSTDEHILSGYFHSCVQALIICQALEIEPDVFINKVCSPPSYPLMKIMLFPENSSVTISKKTKLTSEFVDAVDEIVYAEYLHFDRLLNESAWVNRADLLPVKLWRGFCV